MSDPEQNDVAGEARDSAPNAPAALENPARRQLRRKLPWVLSLVLITGLVAGTAGYVITTEAGLRWAFTALARAVPGELHADRIEGRLIGPLAVHGLKYSTAKKNISLSIEKLEADIQPLALLYERAHITRLDISGVDYTQRRSSEPLTKPPDIRLPLGVTLDRASITRITVNLPDLNQSHKIDSIVLQGKTLFDRLHIDTLEIKSSLFHAGARGTLTPQNNYPLNINITWSAAPSGYPAVTGHAMLTGNLVKQLQIAQSISAPLKARLHGTVQDLFTAIQWQADLSLDKTNIQNLNARWPVTDITGKLHGEGTAERVTLNSVLAVTYQQYTVNSTARAHFSQNKWRIEQATLALPGKPARIVFEADLGSGFMPPTDNVWHATGRWRDLAWPLVDTAAITSKEGKFQIKGNPDAYQFTLDADLASAAFPAGKWSATGKGGREGLSTSLQTDILGGKLTGQGEVSWRPAHQPVLGLQLAWSVDIEGHHLNPGQHWPAWPGELDIQARISHAPQQQSVITLELNALHGQLRGIPLDGSAVLTVDRDQYTLPHLALASGTAQLNASGTLGETWDLQWNIDVQDVARVLPEAPLKHSGTLRGKGNLSGPRKTPRIIATLDGRNLIVDAYRANELHLAFDVDMQNQLPSVLDVLVKGAAIGNQSMDSIAVQGRGQTQDHVLNATLKTAGKTLVLRAEGGLGESAGIIDSMKTTGALWAGQLTQAEVMSQDLGRWPLAAPGALTIGADHAQLGPWCWTQRTAQVCFNAMRRADSGWHSNAHAKNLPMIWFSPLLPKKTVVAGTVDATVIAHLNPAGIVMGSGKLIPSPGAVIHPLAEDQNLVLAYTNGLVEATLDADTLNMRAGLTLIDKGTLNSALTLPRSALPPFLKNPASQVSQLSGQLNAEIHELGLLPDFFPDIEDTQGKVKIALAVDGTPDQPRFTGNATLKQGTALIPRMGLRLRDINIQLTGANENQMLLEAQARSGNGVLRVHGKLQPGEKQNWSANLTVHGENFEFIRTAEIKVSVSPDLTLKITGNNVDINGDVLIPETNIELRDLTTAIRPSSDVVIQDKALQQANAQRWQVSSVIGVKLGNNVKFKGVGLTGRFTGDIALIDLPQQLTTAFGEIRIEEGGEYRAINQKLKVKKGGRLVFAGGPINNPGIDARAARQINANVTVGFNVRGTLQSPQLSVYSEPSMPETDALAYLLLGHPMNQATTNEGQQMFTAAQSLGVAGGEFLAQKVGNAFGIEDIRIETSAVASTTSTGIPVTTQQASVVLGKYLSPKLYISYGVGMLDRLNTLRLRYQIGRHWTLEAESGLQSGADLLYTIDKK